MTETDEDKRPRKKKKRQQRESGPWLVIGIVAGILLLIGGVVLVVVWAVPRGNSAVQAKANDANDKKQAAQPAAQPDAPLPRLNPQAKGVVQSVRNAAYRPQRLNELRTIAQFFNHYAAEFNRNPRTLEEFVQYFQRDAPAIAEAVREKYYVVNLNAKANSTNSVVAFESLTEANGHQTARGDGSVSLLAPDELKQMLMQ